jgi:broad specificity phosphatase PhoE
MAGVAPRRLVMRVERRFAVADADDAGGGRRGRAGPERGHAQVAAARAALRAIPFELVVTSPLTRALQSTSGRAG